MATLFFGHSSTTTISPRFSMKLTSSEYNWKDIVCTCNLSSAQNLILHSKDTETGPGVYETALAYTSALKMADNAILFKYTAKSIGMKHGIIPSFMAKPWGNVSTC